LDVPFKLTFKKRFTEGSTATVLDVDAGLRVIPCTDMVNRLIVSGSDKLKQNLKSLFDRFILAKAKLSGLSAEKVVMPEAEFLRMAILSTGFFTALDQLEIKLVAASPIPIGSQLSDCSVCKVDSLILELARGAVVKQCEGQAVPITPLGIALLTCRAGEYGPLPEMLLIETGYGAITESSPNNDRLRILAGTRLDRKTFLSQSATITVVETTIDDMNPEFFPYLIERLLVGGAADAYLAPIYMKKGRPAHLVTVVCSRSMLENVLKTIFKETTTLGVRIREDKKRLLSRYFFKVKTSYGEVNVKAGCFNEGGVPVQYAPEFEDCRKLALQHGVPVKEVYAAAQREAYDKINANLP